MTIKPGKATYEITHLIHAVAQISRQTIQICKPTNLGKNHETQTT
jgi:hypothetical protein